MENKWKTIEEWIVEFQAILSSKKVLDLSDKIQKISLEYVKKHKVAHVNKEWLKDEIKIIPHPYFPKQKEYFYFHRHHCFEMIYVYRGNATNYFADSKLELKQGDILLLNPNIGHCLCTDNIENVVFNYQITKKAFDQTFLSMLSKNQMFYNFFVDYLYQLNTLSNYMYYPYDSANDISIYLQGAIEEYLNQSIGYESMIKSHLSIAFNRMARSYYQKMKIDKKSQEHQKKIFSILSYMNQNYKTVNLQQTAEEFHYSEKYLSRLIKKLTGKTFNEIVINLKLNRAQELLCDSDLSVEEIAMEVGYIKPAPFYKLFKQRYSVTPTQYRKEKREMEN